MHRAAWREGMSLCVVLAGSLICAADGPDKGTIDAKRLEGSWSLMAYVVDGVKAPGAGLEGQGGPRSKEGRFTLKPNALNLQWKSRHRKLTWENDENFESSFELGYFENRRTLDLITKADNKVDRLNGIIRVVDDTIELCFSLWSFSAKDIRKQTWLFGE